MIDERNNRRTIAETADRREVVRRILRNDDRLRERLRRRHLLAARVVALRVARIARADDQGFRRPIGQTESGRKQILFHADAAVLFIRPDAADEQLVVGEVVHLDAVIDARRQRVVLPPYPNRGGDLRREVPLIADVGPHVVVAERVRAERIVNWRGARGISTKERRHGLSAPRRRHPKQERGEAIEIVDRRTAGDRGHATVKGEIPHLRLVVILVQDDVIDAELDVVRSFRPARVGDELPLRIHVVANRAGPVQHKARPGEGRNRRVQRARLAGVRNAEDGAGAIGLGREHVHVVLRIAERPVEHEGLRKDRRHTNRITVDERVRRAPLRDRVERRSVHRRQNRQGAFPARQEPESRVHVEPRTGVVRDLRVDLVIVRVVAGRGEVVVRVARLRGHHQLRQ